MNDKKDGARLFIARAFNLIKWLIIPGTYGDLPVDEITESRRRKTRYLFGAFIALLALLTVTTLLLQDSSVDAPITNDLAVALVFNLLVVLLVIMALLVIRNLIKLYFERKGQVAGARFQTKLVIAFLFMTLAPALLMFAVATELISDTVDNWLNSRIEQTLKESLQVAESLYSESRERTEANAVYLASLVNRRGLIGPRLKRSRNRLLRQKLREYNVDLVQVYDQNFNLVSEATRTDSHATFSLENSPGVKANAALGEIITRVDERPGGSMVISIVPISEDRDGKMKGVVVVAKEITRQLINRVFSISRAFDEYKELIGKKEVIKTSYQVTLALVALVVIFSAIWIGFYLAKGITIPLKTLSEATEEVATGNLNVRIDVPTQNDEVGQLVTAFNRMIHDLRTSKDQLEKANFDLTGKNIELHHRGQYIEAVLDHVAGGVISIDKAGQITTINDSAARMFDVNPQAALGKNYRKVFAPDLSEPVRQMVRETAKGGGAVTEKEFAINMSGQRRTLKTASSVLFDHEGEYMGAVIVFDDLTDVLTAQRSMALREMARVVAHEIKNPLTPIQLNVQRMRRKHDQNADDFALIFEDATSTIIQEVDELKLLVEKFSRLAKLSDAQPSDAKLSDVTLLDLQPQPSALHDVINEVVKLYRDTRHGVKMVTDLDPSIQQVNIDTEQIKRVIINLVENAMDALNGGGEISIRTHRSNDRKDVIMEVADTGHGLAEAVKEKLFQPYFTTKPDGAGLGLAIVSRIIEDHGGLIKVSDNKPEGSVFTIELPAE